MAVTNLDSSGLKPVKRSRRPHAKAKSGCLTCKIRRKKCDETRPSCQRCLSTGRKCDGYAHVKILEYKNAPEQGQSWSWKDCAQHPMWVESYNDSCRQGPQIAPYFHERGCSCPSHTTIQHPVSCLARCPLYVTNPPLLRLNSELEYTCFDYFRLVTGPGLAGYFDSTMWSALILEGCFTEPLILQAVAALGAVAYRYELGITPEAFRYCEIADRLYRTVLRNYKTQASQGGSITSPEITMILGKLFATFEAFQDNPEKATNYITAAFRRVLNHKVTPILTQEQPVNVVLNLQTLRQYFLKLEHQAAYLFGHSADMTWHKLESYSANFLMPPTFDSIEQARDCLFAEARQIWTLSEANSSGKAGLTGTPTTQANEILQLSQKKHINRLMAWTKSYARYSEIRHPTNDPLLKRISRLLKWYREAAFLYLLIISLTDVALADGVEATHHASLTAHFARLLLLSDGLLNHLVPFATSALQDPRQPAQPVSSTPYAESAFWVPSSSSLSMGSTAFSPPPSRSSLRCSLASTSAGGMGLMLGSASCRSSDIRNRLVELMKKKMPAHATSTSEPVYDSESKAQYIHENLWDDLGVYTVAERYSSFEELACERVLKSYHEQAGAESETNWVDITYFKDERMLCLVYCKPDTGLRAADAQIQTTGTQGVKQWQGPMRVGGGFKWIKQWFHVNEPLFPIMT